MPRQTVSSHQNQANQPSTVEETTPDKALSPAGDRAEPQEPPSWLLLAHILRPQGRRGEVLAELHTDHPERFEEPSRVFLARPGFAGPPADAIETQVLGFFLPVGKNSGRIVLHLDAADSISAAEKLAGLDVLVPREERLELEEDAAFVDDLLGCSVFRASSDARPEKSFEAATLVGVVDDVQFPTTSDGTRRLAEAAPLLAVLSPTGDEVLIPYVKAYLVEQDFAAKRILMSLPDGLVEANA